MGKLTRNVVHILFLASWLFPSVVFSTELGSTVEGVYPPATAASSSALSTLRQPVRPNETDRRDRGVLEGFFNQRGIIDGGTPAVNVLSIDGGGVRGVIPAKFLEKLEDTLGLPTRKIFDLVVGTSTGAILSLGLTEPKRDGTYRTAADMVTLYRGLSADIFPTKWKIVKALELPFTYLYRYKYSPVPLERNLEQVLGERTLSGMTTPTVITSVEAGQTTLKLFSSYRAQWKVGENFKLKDVARATSAAPSYFPMAPVTPVLSPSELARGTRPLPIKLVDGGMYANNPSVIALCQAYGLFGLHRHINLISLGTGEKRLRPEAEVRELRYIWRATPTIDALFDAQSQTAHKTLEDLKLFSTTLHYHRVQVPLTEPFLEMDRSDNVDALAAYAHRLFNGEEEGKIEAIRGELFQSLLQRNIIERRET